MKSETPSQTFGTMRKLFSALSLQPVRSSCPRLAVNTKHYHNMPGGALSVFLTLLILSSFHHFCWAHPFCLDENPPSVPEEPLRNCKLYNEYPGTCCTTEKEFAEVWYPRGRLVAGRDAQSRQCRNVLSRLLCASCNPYAAHIFGGEGGEPQIWPHLCQPFCSRFYTACADVEINTDARIFVPLRIPGLSRGRGIVKIRDLFPSSSSYCSRFGSSDRGACHTDNPSEPVGPPPPEGRVIKLSPAYPEIDFESVQIQNPAKNRRHITDVQFIPGSDNVAVSFQTGQIIVFQNRRGASSYSLLLDIRDRIHYHEASELGLMGVTFDPNFAQNRYFYLKYTKPSNVEGSNSIVVSRFRKNRDSWTTDGNTERILFNVNRPGTQHHSGSPVFDENGLMFVPMGDGINCCTGRDRPTPARDLSSIRGKLLRIDTRRSASEDNDYDGPLYTIPSDNPFKSSENARPEIYSYGLRNPYKISYDKKFNEVWVGDVGETSWEEVDVIRPGKDYGWPLFEGNVCFSKPKCRNLVGSNYEGPIVVHPHDCPPQGQCFKANAVIGGHWYYEDTVSLLKNKYIYGDWSSGALYSLSVPSRSAPRSNPSVQRIVPNFTPKLNTQFSPSIFVKDANGELLVANWWKPQIFRIYEDTDNAQTTTPAYAMNDGEEVGLHTWLGSPESTFDDDDDDAVNGTVPDQ